MTLEVTDPISKSTQHLKAVQAERGNPLISFFMSDKMYINEECVIPLYDQLQRISTAEGKPLDIFLYSRGGTTETPWKIVTLIHEYFPYYNVLIPYRAHSAATHVSIGASELIMGPLSELSPVDPTRMHPLLPKDQDGQPIPISVQDLKYCISFLKNEAKDRYTAEAVAEIYTELFRYINPLALGAIEQSYRLARLISRKILETRMDPAKEAKKIQHIVDILSADYQSHAYPINRHEVVHDLGLNGVAPSAPLWKAMWNLFLYYRELTTQSFQDEKSDLKIRYLAFIDSEKYQVALRQVYRLEQDRNGNVGEQILSTQWTRI